MNIQDLTRLNLACHEAGHICGACSRNLLVSAALEVFDTEHGQASAATYRPDDAPVEDVLFLTACGIAASQKFGLGEAGLLKDRRDIDKLAVDEATKMRVQQEAGAFVESHAETIINLAYSLFYMGSLDAQTTRAICSGTTPVQVPPDFRDALVEVAATEWRRPEQA